MNTSPLASNGSRRLREVESATPSFRCQLAKRSALEIPSSLPLLLHVAGKRTVTCKMGIRSVSRSPRSPISEQLIPPLDKPFFDSLGNRSVKAIHPAKPPSVS